MNGKNLELWAYGVLACLFLIGAGGWCANIWKILTSGFVLSEWGGMEIMRVIGIFLAPLGAMLGFF